MEDTLNTFNEMTSRSTSKDGPSSETLKNSDNSAWFVLVGGEASISFGGEYLEREWAHASVTWIGRAYNCLRERGIPKEKIITIAQIRDYFEGLARCKAPDVLIKNYKSAVTRLLEEGGPDYDGKRCNPTTLLNVLLGKEALTSEDGTQETFQKVIPASSARPVFLAIYSHGDSHPTKLEVKEAGERGQEEGGNSAVAGGAQEVHSASDTLKRSSSFQEVDWRKHEWYIHFPFPGHESSILPSVTTIAVPKKYNFRCHLYAQHLAMAFAELFKRFPKRPIITLLNACRSGYVHTKSRTL